MAEKSLSFYFQSTTKYYGLHWDQIWENNNFSIDKEVILQQMGKITAKDADNLSFKPENILKFQYLLKI